MNCNIAYAVVMFTAFLSAVSQIMLNLSNKRTYKNVILEYFNVYVVSSYIILAVVLVLNTYVLKFLPMMESHAIAASTYVFVLFLGKIVLKEKITLQKLIGNIIIVLGIIVFTQ